MAGSPRSAHPASPCSPTRAVPLDEFDRAVLAGRIKDTEEDVADSKDDWQRDKLAHRLGQLRALQAALSH